MADMAPLFSLFALVPIVISGIVFYAHQRTFGSLDITTSSVAYNRTLYRDAINWDKYALTIEGEPVLLFSGEFHYWRVPDRERWLPILKAYRTMGMNAVRIYFHWGYHSPDEGVYIFDGNRDVEYLLSLCEELRLYVLAAPGPYICAETQAGGYPAWLIAKRELRIRHSRFMLWRTYDENFANYEVQWLNHILPIIARHQITANSVNKNKGCVIGLQLDNELFETMARILPIGLHDQMRILAKASRDAGITVPLFSNDGFEEGSWVPRPELDNKSSRGFWSRNRFGLDLYGFDKYVILSPASDPSSWFFNMGTSTLNWKPWNPKNIENSMDGLERSVQSYGGGAKESPMFIPELQGGWFNHYQLSHTYDQIYDYYGDEFTKMMVETSLAQRVTMVSLYIVYGGTNWGTLGDPDVYTSYDYSACIREYGYLSMRGRRLRETILFTRSFDQYFAKTERVAKPNIQSSVAHTINLQRVAVGSDQAVEFTFFRNFDRKKRDLFDVTVGSSFTLSCHLPYRASFIALGNYKAANGLHLIQSTLPILLRMAHPEQNAEIWIIQPDPYGALAFAHSEVEVSGNMQNEVLQRDGPASILKFDRREGWTKLTTPTGDLYLIGLTGSDVSTLYADFEEAYWNNGKKEFPAFAAWGADSMFYNPSTKKLEIRARRTDSQVHVVSFNPPSDQRLQPVQSGVHIMPYVYTMNMAHKNIQNPLSAVFHLDHWQSRTVQWETLPWIPLKRMPGQSKPSFDPLDYHYLSGHVLYRTSFNTPSGRVHLKLNARNRATVLVNDQIVGGHTTYSRQLFMPGAKIGPDPTFLGSHTYDLTNHLRHDGLENSLIVIVDSFGLSRQAFIMNDVRNPRGVLSVKLSGLEQAATWQIAGNDVRDLSNPYNSTGFPDERSESVSWDSLQPVVQSPSRFQIPLSPAQGVQWLQFTFDKGQPAGAAVHLPVRLHLDGTFSAYILLNDMVIGRYYGNGDGPQHDFYVPDALVRPRGNHVKMLVYTWEITTADVWLTGWPVDLVSGNLLRDMDDDTEAKPSDYIVWEESVGV